MHRRCSQFGFDKKIIAQRLAFLRLSKADHVLAKRLNAEVIAPNVDKIITRFYETLLFHAESRQWLLDAESIERFKKTQSEYLLNLGLNFDTEEYFEYRLKIGVMHAVVGLPLSTYQCAYGNLVQYIIAAIPESIQQNISDNQALTHFIIKIISLDMSLAIETYHASFMNELEDEVKTAHSREVKLQSQAETDSLTGLYNRKYVFSYLSKAIANAHQYATNLCLLMLDIDHFKKVNDSYGHPAGDEVLKQVATEISKTLRDHDIVGRYGGEEFIAGLIDITPEKAFEVAERIRCRIAEIVTTINEQRIQVTVSIGIHKLNAGDDLKSMIQNSDAALYMAKNAGRNCVIKSPTTQSEPLQAEIRQNLGG